jgi:hypothetical protein
LVGEEDAAGHVRVIGGVAGRPGKRTAADDGVEAEGVRLGDLGVGFELEGCAEAVAGVDAEQGAEDAGVAGGWDGHFLVWFL